MGIHRPRHVTRVGSSACAVALIALGWFLASSRMGADNALADVDVPILASPPVASSTCSFTNTWHAPRSADRLHQGVDIIATAGTPVLAVADGAISRVRFDRPGSLAGNHLNVQWSGGSTYFTYLHLESFAPGMTLGAPVKAGDVIGYVGRTGSASVPHLHFEVHPHGGDAVDPTPFVQAVNTCGRRQQLSADPQSPMTTSTTSAKPTGAPTPTAPPAAAPAPANTTRSPIAVPVTPMPQLADSSATQADFSSTTVSGFEPPSSNPNSTEVFVSGMASPFEVLQATVIDSAAASSSAAPIELTVTVTSQSAGRAAAWPCGTDGGFNFGSTVSVNGATSVSTITVSPGTDGQICLMADVAASFRVAVNRLG